LLPLTLLFVDFIYLGNDKFQHVLFIITTLHWQLDAKMEKKTEATKRLLFNETRKPLNLTETEGKTLAYRNCQVPKIFQKPLIASAEGRIQGWESGGRSALVYYRGIWYDIEGVKPTGREWQLGIPEGGDTKEEAENELNAGALFFDYGNRNKIPALMKPICLFEYSNIKFRGKPLYAPVLTSRGDYRLNSLFADYSTAAGEAYETLKNDPDRDARIDQITSNIKEGLTDKIGLWVGFWYRCLEENNHLWGTDYVKNPDRTYAANSNVGNNNLAAYRLKSGVAIGINDLNGYVIPDQNRRNIEIDRIKKRLSIWEVTLYLLKHGKSVTNVSQYQVLQTYASRLYTQITPPTGINYFQEVLGYDPLQETELPQIDELDIIRRFNDGRNGKKPELIDEEYIINVKNFFVHSIKSYAR